MKITKTQQKNSARRLITLAGAFALAILLVIGGAIGLTASSTKPALAELRPSFAEVQPTADGYAIEADGDVISLQGLKKPSAISLTWFIAPIPAEDLAVGTNLKFSMIYINTKSVFIFSLDVSLSGGGTETRSYPIYTNSSLNTTASFDIGDYTFTRTDPYNSETLTLDFATGSYAIMVDVQGEMDMGQVGPVVIQLGSLLLPADPKKEGHTFVGWYLDEQLTIPYDGGAITGDITLYAKFEINKHTLTFNSNSGSAVSPKTVDWGTVTTSPTTTREGYTFKGWFTDAGLTNQFNFSTPIKQDYNFYAKWTIDRHTVTFESNGGSSVTSQTVDWGTTITKPADPTKDGHTFGGWFTNAGLTVSYNFTTLVKSTFTLYAKFTINTHTVTFNSNGGSSVTAQTVDWGTTITKPADPTKAGHTFAGWFTDSGLATSYNFTTLVKSNFELFAKWTINKYTVNFTTNGGTTVQSQTVNYNTTLAEVSTTREGYNFQGWFTDSIFSASFVFTTPVLDHMTLFAKWEIKRFTVTFMVDGVFYDSITVDYGTTLDEIAQSHAQAYAAIFLDESMEIYDGQWRVYGDTIVYAEATEEETPEDPEEEEPNFFAKAGDWIADNAKAVAGGGGMILIIAIVVIGIVIFSKKRG